MSKEQALTVSRHPCPICKGKGVHSRLHRGALEVTPCLVCDDDRTVAMAPNREGQRALVRALGAGWQACYVTSGATENVVWLHGAEHKRSRASAWFDLDGYWHAQVEDERTGVPYARRGTTVRAALRAAFDDVIAILRIREQEATEVVRDLQAQRKRAQDSAGLAMRARKAGKS